MLYPKFGLGSPYSRMVLRTVTMLPNSLMFLTGRPAHPRYAFFISMGTRKMILLVGLLRSGSFPSIGGCFANVFIRLKL